LFERNCQSKAQVIQLTKDLKYLLGRDELPILIDEEGGRVRRLKTPEFKKFPPAGIFFEMARKDINKAKLAVYLNYLLMALELRRLGITVNCAPVADILFPYSNKVIHERCFGNSAELVSLLAHECSRAMIDGGVYPVIKHIPGHGRAKIDSHEDLPIIDEELSILQRTDFSVFKNLKQYPLAMTSHILYSAIDNERPATLSKKVISFIREKIEYDGIIMTDDINMKALKGTLGNISSESLESGCDLVLHCSGEINEMQEVDEAITISLTPKLNKFLKHFKLEPIKIKEDSVFEKYEKILNENAYAF
jgi:beta-N-acetylhexosaminidase